MNPRSIAAILLLTGCTPDIERRVELFADPVRIDAAAAALGDGQATATATVANVGTAPAEVTAVTLVGDGTNLSLGPVELPLVLLPGDIVQLTVILEDLSALPVGGEALLSVDADGLPVSDPAGCQTAVSVGDHLDIPVLIAVPDGCDTDLDGFLSAACGGPDCDDTSAAVFPGADEVCNGVDDDCDGVEDEPGVTDGVLVWPDGDGDGYGNGDIAPIEVCEVLPGSSTDPSDCDDVEASVNPDADEVCNGVDDDCNGVPDDDPVDGTVAWPDADSDSFGAQGGAATWCEVPSGHVFDGTDCDDGDASVFPGAPEVCDGVDNDCDGTADGDATWYVDADADGFGDPDATVVGGACTPPPGTSDNDQDCDDADPAANPDADEFCDGHDDDCDGAVDENDAVDAPTWYRDVDADLYGNPNRAATACARPAGWRADGTDCNDADASVHPGAPEICDGKDNDCDGALGPGEENFATWYPDEDLDSWGADAGAVVACVPPPGHVLHPGDCDDTDPDVNPDASEQCNAVDDDCSGDIDDGGVCPCPMAWDRGRAYGLCTLAVPWQLADLACGSAGYALVTVDDVDEDVFLASQAAIVAPGPWWIGYSDSASEGSWSWADGTPPDYEAWAPGAPSTGFNFDDCATINDDPLGWVDTTCFSFLPFICEAG